MSRYATVLMEKRDKNTGKGVVLYEGDDIQGAIDAAEKACNNPKNVGKFIRQYDYVWPHGGMRDVEIIGPLKITRP